MKVLILFIIPIISLAADWNPDVELYRISKIDSPKQVFKELKILEKKNLKRKQSLLKEKTYRGNEFHYVLTLEKLLTYLPKDFSQISKCESLYQQILNGDKRPWKNHDQPTHKLWPAFEKVCKK